MISCASGRMFTQVRGARARLHQSCMKHDVLTQSHFDNLLDWLDSNRDRAGEKYETIRRGLIQVFEYRGCVGPEDLADETINRVARRVEEVRVTYTGDPARYFYGVGKKVHMEYLKQKQPGQMPAVLVAPEPDDTEQQYQCLDRCMGKLTDGNRTLILQYYHEQKRARIDSRRGILQVLNLKPGALRVRVFRIRETLEKCVRECIEIESRGVRY
jgi:DNA-directed RNA polymerase specialized sigma24 family protein